MNDNYLSVKMSNRKYSSLNGYLLFEIFPNRFFERRNNFLTTSHNLLHTSIDTLYLTFFRKICIYIFDLSTISEYAKVRINFTKGI